ncbi:prepilin-type N-terminal cleavage/methylation domain-containing protein [Candidatus Poribacteria bacterium]|nr:prepilin-type N-terminal cleavage/methylation domain-containing protein [Candidatus Poribacteria bacterium]MYH81017.1 prepilin-type N-terminal cleavage/methylation domain-containing protein [Candidatus Poribacteria bacterium]MYK95974.1 prepilin-type N-terminal cleavage/methylation domain-containing protein [Candidatus Poribacteria bacterium]
MKIQKISTHGTSESGLTLIEMLMAVSILVIIGGSAYFAFKTAVDAYHQTEARILAAQRSRFAMDRIVTDLGNMQVSLQDPELALYTQDVPSQSGDQDMLSFVTLAKTDPDPFLEQLSSFQAQDAAQAPLPLLSDVQRVAYLVAPEPQPGESALNSGSFQGGLTDGIRDEQSGSYALFRVATTVLDPEVVIGPFLQTGTIPETDENGEPIYVDIATLITGLANFNLQYFDAEAEMWNASWDDPESMPSAVQILITVQGEAQRAVSTDTTQFATQSQQPVMPSNSMTQSTMVYLPASATAGGGAEGAPQGGP